MSSWEQRGNYLIEVSQRCLKGHKTFDLCRSHLVQASQISKGHHLQSLYLRGRLNYCRCLCGLP